MGLLSLLGCSPPAAAPTPAPPPAASSAPGGPAEPPAAPSPPRAPREGRGEFYLPGDDSGYRPVQAWSAGMELAAVALEDRSVGVYRVPTLEPVAAFAVPGAVTGLALRDDGAAVCVTTERGAFVRDLRESRATLAVPLLHDPGSPRALCAPGAGSLVTLSFQGRLTAFDARTGEIRWSEDVPRSTRVIRFGSDGAYLLTAQGKSRMIRDAATGRKVLEFPADPGDDLPVSPDLRHLVRALDDGKSVEIVDVARGEVKLRRRFQGQWTFVTKYGTTSPHPVALRRREFSPDGRAIAMLYDAPGSSNGMAVHWNKALVADLDAGKWVDLPGSRFVDIEGFEGGRDPRFVQVSMPQQKGEVVVWSAKKKTHDKRAIPEGSAGWSPRPRWRLEPKNNGFQLTDEQGAVRGRLAPAAPASAPPSPRIRAATGPDARQQVGLWTASGAGFLWAASGDSLRGLDALRGLGVSRAQWLDPGELVAEAGEARAIYRATVGGKQERADKLASGASFVLSREAVIVAAETPEVLFFDRRSGARLGGGRLPGRAAALALSVDGRSVAAAHPHGVAVFDVQTREPIFTTRETAEQIAFDSAGALLLFGASSALRLDGKTGAAAGKLEVKARRPVFASPDGKVALIEGDLRRLSDGATLAEDVGESAAFTADGARVAAVHAGQRVVSVIEAATGHIQRTAPAASGARAAGLAGDLLTVEHHGGVTLFRLSDGESLTVWPVLSGGSIRPIYSLGTGHFDDEGVAPSPARVLVGGREQAAFLQGEEAARFRRGHPSVDFFARQGPEPRP